MSRLNQLLKAEKHTRNYHRAPTSKQKEYALELGIDPTGMTFPALSAAIDEAKESRFAAWCREYEALDSDLQRTGDILTIAESLTTLKKDGNGWHSGPCPKCGGKDRFYINTKDNLFRCGHAQGGNGCGWAGGLAQLAAYAWNCSTWDAIDTLTGQSPRKHSVISARKSTRVRRKAEKPASDSKPYLDFSDASRASQAALKGVGGQAGRDYLLNRGITRETWETNRVGLSQDARRGLAVCFPHSLLIDSKMQVISLNRRFLDDEARHAKIAQAAQAGKKLDIPKTKHVKGGRWGLYRLATATGAKALIVVEGEVNGLSVWLVVRRVGWLIDVVSVGSEGAFRKLAAAISEAARSYEQLIIWADDAGIADKASRAINHHAPIKALRSPIVGGEELDANDLLVRGVLTDFLKRVLPSALFTPNELAIDPTPDAKSSVAHTPVGNIATNDLAFHHSLNLTGKDSLLELCAALVSQLADYEQARRWYLVCEQHYCDGDFTSLLECLEAIREAKGGEPNFPELPPTRPNYNDYPVIAPDDPFHRWVWAARAVKLGHLDYYGEAREWASKIFDSETREQAFREMDRLIESLETTQMKLL